MENSRLLNSRTGDMTVAETVGHIRRQFEAHLANAIHFREPSEVIELLKIQHELDVAAYLELPQHLTVAEALEQRWSENRV